MAESNNTNGHSAWPANLQNFEEHPEDVAGTVSGIFVNVKNDFVRQVYV